MKKPVFTGSSVAVVTPFNLDLSVNYDKLKELIEFNIANGTDCITICGTTGEASTLDDSEHKKCIEVCVNTVNGRVPVIAGTGSNDTAYALELSLFAKEAGADALLSVTPYYNKTTQKGLVKHFTYIADRVDLPMILYNVPSRTGISIAAETYKELSLHKNINGTKEASGNFKLITQTRALCGDELNIWSGNDDEVVPILALGGRGVISVAANIVPKIMHSICALYFEGKTAEAAELAIKWFDLCNDIFVEVNPIPIKTAMNIMGMNAGALRMPLYEMAEKNEALLKNTLSKYGLV